MELYIVRHGETVWNKEKRLQGRTNIPLSPYGRELAEKTGEALKNIRIDKIFASPLDRAFETALLIRGERNIELVKDERLLELNFGSMEGKTQDELCADANTTFQYFFSNPELYHAQENGESLEKLCERAAEFMRTKIEPNEEKWQRVMIVAHGAVNKALMSYIKGHSINEFWSGGLQKNCNVIIVSYAGGEYQVVSEENTFYNEL